MYGSRNDVVVVADDVFLKAMGMWKVCSCNRQLANKQIEVDKIFGD